ncbi:MAG: phosphohydrolase [Candidatus Thorarchaeota archaeon]
MNESRKPLVIYHYPCADGFTSAWIAWKEFGDDAEYLPQGYSDNPEIPDVDNRIVYLLDYAYRIDVMREIAERAETVIVLDHHKSAEEDLLPLFEEGLIEGEFDMERSGAGITWDWFNVDAPRPALVRHVEDRDLWNFTYPDTREINIALFSYPYEFEAWDQFETSVGTLISEGRAILRKHTKDVHELIEQTMYLTIGGHDNISTVNANYMFGSDLAAVLAKGQPFAAYFWINANGEYVFGLRSNKDEPQAVDVGEIAFAYGGGGHKHASGFRIKNLSEL